MSNLRDNADWSNPHAEMRKRIGAVDVTTFPFKPVRAGEVEYGKITEPTLRSLCYLYELERKIKSLELLMRDEFDSGRRYRLAMNADEIELEINFVLGLYFVQIHMEEQLLSWEGSPIFTIREHAVAVIRPKDLHEDQIRLNEEPYSRNRASNFFRKIALSSFPSLRH